jgi:transposase-like protein
MPKAKSKGGRPSSYDPSVCERIIALGAEGKSKAQIARGLGVVRNTLDNWASEHPEFLNALKASREAAMSWWEDQGQLGITADKFNATAFIFQMKNRFPDDYRDRQEVTGADGGAIKFERVERAIVGQDPKN